jgi:hypothetical protein
LALTGSSATVPSARPLVDGIEAVRGKIVEHGAFGRDLDHDLADRGVCYASG